MQPNQSRRRRRRLCGLRHDTRHGRTPADDGLVPVTVKPAVELADAHHGQGVRQRPFHLSAQEAADRRGGSAVVVARLLEKGVHAELPGLGLGLAPAHELEQRGGDDVQVLRWMVGVGVK